MVNIVKSALFVTVTSPTGLHVKRTTVYVGPALTLTRRLASIPTGLHDSGTIVDAAVRMIPVEGLRSRPVRVK